MGGCCCSAKGAQLTAPAGYNYCSRTIEEQVPLPAHDGIPLILSSGLLVDTNLDTSIPDTYRSPPAPAPYDIVLGHPQNPPGADKVSGDKSDAAAKTGATEETAAGEKTEDSSVKCDDLRLPDCKEQSDFDIENEKELESNPSKSLEPVIMSIEECPTCLEEYDLDNPKVLTKCEHHFHLACILEWLERSDTCPVCGQEMVFDPPIS
ncbi:probable E3 ubiquitin-protein ligase RHB1A [Punica granatum]|nr:probable E3 ubiquitin-protein ligase RHB1A [Punica granatum]